MAVTLGTARTEVRNLLNEANPQFWTNAQLNSWINQGAQDIARRAENLWRVGTVPVVATYQNYPWPTDVVRLHAVDFLPTSNTPGQFASTFQYPLEFRGYLEASSIWGVYQQFPAAWPEWFVLIGNSGIPGQPYVMRLFPVPSISGAMQIHYYRQAVPAANDSALVDVVPGWEDLVYDYTVAKAKRKDNDTTWQDAQSLYETRLNDMIGKTQTFTDQPGTVSTGLVRWPPWASGQTDWF